MNSIDGIWKSRLNHHINETRSYLKYILNDHLLIVFIFLAAGGALAYSNWLKTVSLDFPVVLLMTIVFSFIVLNSAVRTLVKEADMMFLLPMEHKLKSYFRQAFIYSFISQSFLIVVLLIVFAPLYVKVTAVNGMVIFFQLLLLLIVKWWNLRISWKMGFFTEPSVKWSDLIVRFALNICGIYFIFSEQYLFSLLVFIIMAIYDVYFSKAVKPKAIKWDQLIKQEESKKQSFYKLANLFTDVPKLKKSAKRRKYLDWILQLVKYQQENVYSYLYMRGFIRSGDYLGIFVRLTIIGSLLLVFIDVQLVGYLIIVLVFTFLTGIQLMSLYKHFDLLELPNLYPNAEKHKLKSFLTVINFTLLAQALIFTLVIFSVSTLDLTAFTLGVNTLFINVFVLIYMKNRLK